MITQTSLIVQNINAALKKSYDIEQLLNENGFLKNDFFCYRILLNLMYIKRKQKKMERDYVGALN